VIPDAGEKSSPLLTLSRAQGGPAAAQVLELVRSGGVVSREQIVARGDLSPATVRRVTSTLIEANLLRERTDLAQEGLVGRPRVPVEIDPEGYLVIGVHIGRRRATVALGDLTGRVIAHAGVPRVPEAPLELATLSRVAAHLLGRVGGREPLALGLVAPWRELGASPDENAAQMAELTGLEVRTGDPVGSIAAADHFQRDLGAVGYTLYLYAGDTLGWAVIANRGARTEFFRGSSLTHFPTPLDVPCGCGRNGCLEAVAGEDRFAERLHAQGLVPEPTAAAVYAQAGDPEVLAALRQRARLLGRTGAAVRDMMGPDRVILAGGGYTGCPDVLGDVMDEFELATPNGPAPVEFARFGSGEAMAACTIALGPVYEDPLRLAAPLAGVSLVASARA
jgi:predicted NBD/HSP70 family sugar kinase